MLTLVDGIICRALRTPYFHLAGYMQRWWLLPYLDARHGHGCGPVRFWRRPLTWLMQRLGIAVRIHHILRSDAGRDPHDHPWPYVTIILRGGYIETRYDDDGQVIDERFHGPGSLLVRSARSWHRLTIDGHSTAWTLFITGPYRQGWGFNVNGRKVPWREYLTADASVGRDDDETS